MDVICERCRTEYEFDDARLTDEGVTVKCSTCGHLFRVRRAARPAVDVAASLAAPAAPASEPPADADDSLQSRDWMVRTRSGDVLYFKNLVTLRRWIGDRRVSREDEISKSGDAWKRLGDIVELEGFFTEAEPPSVLGGAPGAPAGAAGASGGVAGSPDAPAAVAGASVVASGALTGAPGAPGGVGAAGGPGASSGPASATGHSGAHGPVGHGSAGGVAAHGAGSAGVAGPAPAASPSGAGTPVSTALTTSAAGGSPHPAVAGAAAGAGATGTLLSAPASAGGGGAGSTPAGATSAPRAIVGAPSDAAGSARPPTPTASAQSSLAASPAARAAQQWADTTEAGADPPVPTAVTRAPGPPAASFDSATMRGHGGPEPAAADAATPGVQAGLAPAPFDGDSTVRAPLPGPTPPGAPAAAAPSTGGPARAPGSAATAGGGARPAPSPAPSASAPAAAPAASRAPASAPPAAATPRGSAVRPASGARVPAPLAAPAPRAPLRIEAAPRGSAPVEEPKVQIAPELLAEREPAWASVPSRATPAEAAPVPTDVVRVPAALQGLAASTEALRAGGALSPADLPTPVPGTLGSFGSPAPAATAPTLDARRDSSPMPRNDTTERRIVLDEPDPDEDVAALEAATRGRGGRVFAGMFLVALAVGIGGLVWRIAAPDSFEAMRTAVLGDDAGDGVRSALESARSGLRRDSRRSLAEAQATLEGVRGAGGGGSAVDGLLAQVHVAQARIAIEESAGLRARAREADATEVGRRVQRLVEEARVHQDAARELGRSATGADPKALEAWVALAELAVLERDREAFGKAVQTASTLGRDEPSVLHVRGAAALGLAGTVEDALFYLKRAVAADAERLRARVDLARAHAARKEFEDARAALAEVLRANPEHERAVDLNGELGRLAAPGASGASGPAGATGSAASPPAAEGRAASAGAAARPASGGAPAASPAPAPSAAPPSVAGSAAAAAPTAGKGAGLEELLREGDRHRLRGNCPAATTSYERARAAGPGDARPLVGIAWCAIDAKQYDRALADLRRALALSPDMPEAIMGVAEGNRLAGHTGEAMRWYERYLKVAPDGPEAAVARQNLAAAGR